MKLFNWSTLKSRIITTAAITFMMLIMASPALANSSSWYFYMDRNGYAVDGQKNGIYHHLTAGTLTLSGKVWTAAIAPGATTVRPVTIEVWKDGIVDSKVCSAGPYYTSANNTGQSYAVTVSKNCGSISDSDYHLFIWRSASDGRDIEGSGTLSTP
jgi:hypothetical protein